MILVDSDVLIAHLRGHARANDWLVRTRQATGPLAISVVSVAEIAGGMRSGERRHVWRLLESMHVEDVNELIARRAGELMRRYRRSHGAIGLGDYLIAGTADVRGLDLATLNVRHYPMFKGLRAPFRAP
ncbi:MAG: type II toxin-antitoxin system VapC family toxin [Actinomycetota bacterium]|nr:type II toxin-antitoxin system VapC family toxin [Actinomycetota bacterium]